MSALLALAIMQAATAQGCRAGICDPERIASFLQKLRNSRRSGPPVRIMQIGDSHTAGDQITGSWRTLLQTRYGSGGRGTMAPGRPYQGYLTRGITARQSEGWSTSGIFGLAYAGSGAPPIGLTGYTLSSMTIGSSMTLSADANELFDRFTVCAMRGPGRGTVVLTIGSARTEWDLLDDHVHPDCKSVETEGTTSAAGVTVVAGPVALTSWSTERRRSGGIVLSNLGTVGAQLVHFDRTDETVVSREFAEYAPDLIVLAFGTNEAFKPNLTTAEYGSMLRSGIRRIQRLAPGVPILMLGAPDSATKQPALQWSVSGNNGGCRTNGPLVVANEAFAPTSNTNAGNAWQPTKPLDVVQTVGRSVARELGVAYWDWSRRMGGPCTADAWTRRLPPLMRGDHVHFTASGGTVIAGLLEEDLDAALAAVDDAVMGESR